MRLGVARGRKMSSTEPNRTPLQKRADQLDRDLYRLLSSVEHLYDRNKRNSVVRKYLADSLSGLRGARVGLRSLMHKFDRERTV